MSERIERYVLHLSLPADVPARVGPVTVMWPGDPPVEAGVLGAYFVEPAEFMAEQEAAPDLLAAARSALGDLEFLAAETADDQPTIIALRAAIAKATGQEVPA